MNSRTVIFTAVLAATCVARASDWPQWRGPNRDGISAESDWSSQWPADGPKQLWRGDVGTGCSSVAVVGDRVFTMGNQSDSDTVWCLDAKTGVPVWKHTYASPLDPRNYDGGPGSTPAVDGNFVFTLSRTGQLFCLDALTGKPVWSKQLVNDFGGKPPKWGYSGSPLVAGDLLVVETGASGASAVALDKKTGTTVWKSGIAPAGYSTITPFSYGGKACAASFDGTGLTVRETKTGKELATYPWETPHEVNAATPIVSGDKIFIASGYGKGCALLKFDGSSLQPLWENTKMKNHFSSSVLWKDHLYGFDDSTLACLDLADGSVKWTQGGLGKGSLMLAGDKLVIQSESGDLVIAQAAPESFQEVARAKILKDRSWVVPVLANGRIYCKNNKGELVCLDMSGK